MIIYNDTLSKFKDHVILNEMTDILLNSLSDKGISGGSPSEINSWNNSLRFMKDVLDDPFIPKDCQVAIEYNIPQTSKRVDFMIVGNDGKEDHVVIIEVKQWAKVEKIHNDCKHSIMSDLKSHEPVAHPS